jgi:hypothetical protein
MTLFRIEVGESLVFEWGGQVTAWETVWHRRLLEIQTFQCFLFS